MKLHKWNDVKRSATDPARAKRVQERVEAELLNANLVEVEGLGGELEITAVVGDKRVRLTV